MIALLSDNVIKTKQELTLHSVGNERNYDLMEEHFQRDRTNNRHLE